LTIVLPGAADNSPLLVAISDLVKVLLDGTTPNFVRGIIFGANLLAIRKKNGGVRPIAVGYVWRSTTGSRSGLQQRQGFHCCLASAETASLALEFPVEQIQQWSSKMLRGEYGTRQLGHICLLKLTLEMHSTLRRDSILEAVAQHFPELLPYALSTIGCMSTSFSIWRVYRRGPGVGAY
jgi:hypothetical protein